MQIHRVGRGALKEWSSPGTYTEHMVRDIQSEFVTLKYRMASCTKRGTNPASEIINMHGCMFVMDLP